MVILWTWTPQLRLQCNYVRQYRNKHHISLQHGSRNHHLVHKKDEKKVAIILNTDAELRLTGTGIHVTAEYACSHAKTMIDVIAPTALRTFPVVKCLVVV